jgi:hypothetical protein
LQSLVLMSQTIRKGEWGARLLLNGEMMSLGTVRDVVNKLHGRDEFGLSICHSGQWHSWVFRGDRAEMSMSVEYGSAAEPGTVASAVSPLFRLLPPDREHATGLGNALAGLTYITAERVGPREVYPLEDYGIVSVVGTKGENAVSRLFHMRDEEVPEPLRQGPKENLLGQVEAWMDTFFPGSALDIQRVEKVNALTLGLRTSDETDFHRPVHVGFGLTQVLPILVAVLSAKQGDIIVIENPEVHLHPAGQALMGIFLAKAAAVGPQIIVETHSDHILNGIRRAVRSGALTHTAAALYFFRPKAPNREQVVAPQLDAAGNIDFWPEGFFDQFDKDMNHFAGWGD